MLDVFTAASPSDERQGSVAEFIVLQYSRRLLRGFLPLHHWTAAAEAFGLPLRVLA